MQPKIQNYVKRLLQTSEKWRWLVLSFIGLSLLWVEVQEFLVLQVLNQAFHYFEVLQYAILLISTGTLIELYARSNKAHRQALRILEYKHGLSMELTANEDWDLLTAKLAELPSRITDVAESYLLLGNPISEKFEIVSYWENYRHSSTQAGWDPTVPCRMCLQKVIEKSSNFHLCTNTTESTTGQAYSLSIVDPDLNIAVLKFRLSPTGRLRDEERELFINIADEISVALRAGQNRKRVAELQSVQVAMAERRMVSAYVHDQLGQNLGYLHLKLDQLGNDQSLATSEKLLTELDQLQGVANESYEIVRDILKKIQPDTVPHLTNILQEHARKISRRADFSLNFKSTGKPVSLFPEAQQLILYVFYEILNNIEKHARAEQVSVLIDWHQDCLEMSISDNGIGFNLQRNADEYHFGLKILHERIAKLEGSLSIDSSVETGTKVAISIPLLQTREGTK